MKLHGGFPLWDKRHVKPHGGFPLWDKCYVKPHEGFPLWGAPLVGVLAGIAAFFRHESVFRHGKTAMGQPAKEDIG